MTYGHATSMYNDIYIVPKRDNVERFVEELLKVVLIKDASFVLLNGNF